MEDPIGGRSDLYDENNASEGGEGMSSSNGNNVDNENDGVDGEGEHMYEHSDAEVDVDEYRIDNKSDIKRVQFLSLTIEEFKLYHFFIRLVAFEFYNKYALKKGFAGRRWNVLKNKRGEVTQQEFVCYKEGFRDKKHLERTGRKREPRAMARCGCPAICCVRLDRESGRWRVKAFNDVHSHELLGEKYVRMLPAHRKMNDCDVMQMNSMREAGIGVTQIYGLAAKHCGGYNRNGYRKRDMYNEIVRERRIKVSDARSTLSYLSGLGRSDTDLYWRHTVDEEGRLHHLFWCDGRSQSDYRVFGDVVAFDATYRRNKYMCPFVVFAGVNNHNQTIVFGCGLVANETEETYVWLLKQFLDAMKGKFPISVITDGDLTMRNAIKNVFPSAHHRLCAWHLLRNATSNVSQASFTAKFRRCMLGDYEVGTFRRKWEEMVGEFGLEGNEWVRELYEKRKMWATAHIRGNFFAGFRTTSRCEGLNSQIGRYVHVRNNLTDFLKQFSRYMAYTRQRELEADFESIVGHPVLLTPLQDIERFAARVYTRKVLFMFRTVLNRASKLKVLSFMETPASVVYIVGKRLSNVQVWNVSLVSSTSQVKCTCQRMESNGIPCEHIITILHYLDVSELPDCLVLPRWTKYAKQCVEGSNGEGATMTDTNFRNGMVALLFDCHEMCRLAGRNIDKLNTTQELVRKHVMTLKEGSDAESSDDGNETDAEYANVRDPVRVRTKGCGTRQQASNRRGDRRSNCCSVCQRPGHNKTTCPERAEPSNGRRSREANDNDTTDVPMTDV